MWPACMLKLRGPAADRPWEKSQASPPPTAELGVSLRGTTDHIPGQSDSEM